MNSEHRHDDLVELGLVTVETQGGPIGVLDAERTRQPFAGLSDD